ncbi:MAG: hypothetical protein AAGH60_03565 [Pseudomonadota bacterium]
MSKEKKVAQLTDEEMENVVGAGQAKGKARKVLNEDGIRDTGAEALQSSGSPADAKLKGEPAIRHLDLTTGNHG